MDQAVKRTRTSATNDTPVHRLPKDATTEIFLLLPTKSVIRCGAVCKAWRRITTDPHFERRRWPASVLVYTHLPAAQLPRSDLPACSYVLDALPFSSGEAGVRRLVRYRAPLTEPTHCRLLASCEGVLLFKKEAGFYLLCDPVTRQWAELPRLPDEYCKGGDGELAFYFHRPSGEFRLLCHPNYSKIWYIVSTGATGPRHIINNSEIYAPETVTTVALHGNVHWPPQHSSIDGMRMVVFDTVLETFHLMAGPPTSTCPTMKLFKMHGRLVAADLWEKEHVDLWFLEDYNATRWEHRHQIVSPWKENICYRWDSMSVVVASDDEWNVILGDHRRLVVYDTRSGRMVRIIDSKVNSLGVPVTIVLQHVFRETREQHTCFNIPPSTRFPLIHFFFD
ncbi:hypothetical protein ACP70R_005181 [Stipagrostis hirtigluma subsp. patula]